MRRLRSFLVTGRNRKKDSDMEKGGEDQYRGADQVTTRGTFPAGTARVRVSHPSLRASAKSSQICQQNEQC